MFGFRRKKHQSDGAAAPSEPAPSVTISLRAPAPGRLLPLEDVPDPVFSRGLAGQGFAVDPDGSRIAAPIDGEIVMLAETHHAVGLRAPNGAEVVVHVGIDSVTLKGEGLRPRCEVGDVVTAGQDLLEIDRDLLIDRLPSIITPVLVTNPDGFELSDPRLDAPEGAPVMDIRPR